MKASAWSLSLASAMQYAPFATMQFTVITFMAMIVIGSRQHALLILGHEGGHRLVASNQRLNDFLTNLFCFWPFGLDTREYRTFHLSHHRHVGTSDDPELEAKRDGGHAWDLPATRWRIALLFVKDLVFGGLYEQVHLIRQIPSLKRPWMFVTMIALWLIVGTVLFLFGVLWLLVLWFGSVCTTMWAMFRLRVWIEHQGTAGTHRVHASWLIRVFVAPHNTWYHYEHHCYPYIPCFNLPRIRVLLPEPPVQTARELFEWYGGRPQTPSGTAC